MINCSRAASALPPGLEVMLAMDHCAVTAGTASARACVSRWARR